MSEKLNLDFDYMQGAHPAILSRMMENNLVKSGVYGYDDYSESAKEKIRAACEAPNADIWFLVGGTQANATVLDAILRPYEGVISAETGHICIHEVGAVDIRVPETFDGFRNGRVDAVIVCEDADRKSVV